MGSHGGYIPTYTPSRMDNSERLKLIDIEHDWNRSTKNDIKCRFYPEVQRSNVEFFGLLSLLLLDLMVALGWLMFLWGCFGMGLNGFYVKGSNNISDSIFQNGEVNQVI